MPRTGRLLSRRHSEESGASAVEFALVVPLFLMLVMGMITGGFTFNRQLAMTSAAREGTRFGATLAMSKIGGVPDSWLDQVADRAIRSATGHMDVGVPDRYVCVAYIGYGPSSTSTVNWTRKREQAGSNAATYTNGFLNDPTSWCFDDQRGSSGSERRVQVVLRRTSQLNVVLFSTNVRVTAQGVARFEAVMA